MSQNEDELDPTSRTSSSYSDSGCANKGSALRHGQRTASVSDKVFFTMACSPRVASCLRCKHWGSNSCASVCSEVLGHRLWSTGCVHGPSSGSARFCHRLTCHSSSCLGLCCGRCLSRWNLGGSGNASGWVCTPAVTHL